MKSLRLKTMKAFFSLLAVAVLFFATLGIPVSQHWCGGKAVSVKLYAPAKACGMMAQTADPGINLSAPSCCKDELSLLAANGLDNDGSLQAVQKQYTQVDLFASVSGISAAIFAVADRDKIPYALGPPPGSKRDIFSLYQTYLI